MGGVIKGIKFTRIVIKMLKKTLGLAQRLFCSLIRAWQFYRPESLHLQRNLVRSAVVQY